MRTDQTAICLACERRLSPSLGRCPGCGTTDLRDLGRTETRAFLAMNQRRAIIADAEAWDHGLFGNNLALHTLALVGISIALMFIVSKAAFLGIPLALVYILIGVGVRNRARRAANDRLAATDTARGLQLAAPRLPPRRGGAEVRGRVKVLAPVSSPLSGASCAAFRIEGRDDHDNVIDDAALGQIAVVTAEGEEVAIDADAAMVDVDAGPPERVASPSAELRAFLRARGITARDLDLGEGLLLDGDEVVVSGEIDSVAAPAGYRDTTWTRVLRGGGASPLIIRPVRQRHLPRQPATAGPMPEQATGDRQRETGNVQRVMIAGCRSPVARLLFVFELLVGEGTQAWPALGRGT